MRLLPLVVAIVLAAGIPVVLAQDDPPLHTEKGIKGPIVIEEETDYQRPAYKDADGKVVAAGAITYHRLVVDGTLWGTQAAKLDQNVFDAFQALSGLHPLDNIVVAGAMHAFDLRQEPLTYYHRTGPVGAIFKELRTRKSGTDAKAPVAKLGLETGSELAYALTDQHFTIYEADPALKRLVADTDKYFTYVADARNRGAGVEFRIGDRRAKLAGDKDRKYTLILVDPAELYPDSFSLLTKEAIQLYFDRLTDDGIVALHISSKLYRFELAVARVAAELGLAARAWHDDNVRRGPGKTASSWVVLARKPEHLGGLLVPEGDLMFDRPVPPGREDRMRVSMDSQLVEGLADDYEAELSVVSKGRTKFKELNESSAERDGKTPQVAWLEWVKGKLDKATDPREKARLELYAKLIAGHGPFETFQKAMVRDHDHAFRRLETVAKVPLWTDASTEVVPALRTR